MIYYTVSMTLLLYLFTLVNIIVGAILNGVFGTLVKYI
jgi:hypothetical protein